MQSSIYNLVFTGSGTIAKIDVSVGQTVTKGQVLAELDKTSLQDALNAAQATVLSAQTGVNNAEANLSKAEAPILALNEITAITVGADLSRASPIDRPPVAFTISSSICKSMAQMSM